MDSKIMIGDFKTGEHSAKKYILMTLTVEIKNGEKSESAKRW